MDNTNKKVLDLFIRYSLIFLAGLSNLFIFYKLLTYPTIKTTYSILGLFSEAILIENIILIKGLAVEIVPSCVAGAAFYLLFILALSTSSIDLKTRLKIVLTSFIIFFVLNISRIVLLVPLISTSYFETIHLLFWHLVSTVFVVAIWLIVVSLYKIKSIPVYSDIRFLWGLIRPKKKNRKHSKKKKS